MRATGFVWIAFIVGMIAGAVLVTQGRLVAGLTLIGLPIAVTTALTLLYYSRERRKA